MKMLLLLFVASFSQVVLADDWSRFRGPDGAGVALDANVPLNWSANAGITWRVELPGAGSSSPIVFGDRVFVTCYSGHDGADGPSKVKRHLVAVERRLGKILWTRTIESRSREDAYNGFLTEHGYASNTPVTDGERVYVFFGKTGVFAFDWDGNEVWTADVGQESSSREWGSATSPILAGELLIVNAAEESRSLRAFDRKTGQQVWRADGDNLEMTYSTPLLTQVGGKPLLLVATPGELWGVRPETGKLAWFQETQLGGNLSPSPHFSPAPFVPRQRYFLLGGGCCRCFS